MQIEYLNIDEVIPYANNPRCNDGEAVDRVAASIKEYGFKNPIIIDKDNVIVVGLVVVIFMFHIKMDLLRQKKN